MIYCICWLSNLARCRGWRPPGCLNVGICGGPIWLDAEGVSTLAVCVFVFLVFHFWIDAEGGGPHGCLKFGMFGCQNWLDAKGGGARAV